jgi:uroporphyrin-III C-methyltransferase
MAPAGQGAGEGAAAVSRSFEAVMPEPFDPWPFEPGWVWLVGAGPGDPGLVTLRAWDAIRQADAILYDALVDPRILDWAPRAAMIEFAGKRGGQPSRKQRDISLRAIELARQGRRVLRLKGGDPFVFGRGGEELSALVDAGIPFRVIPGVSAGIGGLAAAGIPITHRDVNQSVTFLTGHDRSGETPIGVDWEAVSRGSDVIVLFMAMRHLGEITKHLLNAGRPPQDPAAIISRATWPDQRVIETTLGALADDAAAADLPPPTLICIGGVVSMRRMYFPSDACDERRQ